MVSSKHANVVRFGSNRNELGAEGVYGEVLSVGDKGVAMDPWVLHTGWLFLLNRWNHGDHLRRLIQCLKWTNTGCQVSIKRSMPPSRDVYQLVNQRPAQPS